MRDMLEIAPSLLSADFGYLMKDIESVEKECRFLHLDVMDGHYVPNLSIGIPVIKSIRKYSDMIFDTHLMITEPEKYVKAFADAGSDYITFHIECSDDPSALMGQIRELGKKAGVAIHPDTPIEKIFPYVKEADLILIMSVRPGFGGQSYMEGSTERIAAVRAEMDRVESEAILSVDGGINVNTIAEAHKAGAGLLVAGSACFGKEDPGAAAAELKVRACESV